MLSRPSAALSALIKNLAEKQPADSGWPIEQGRDRGALVIHSSAAFVWYLTPEGKVLVLDIDDFQQRVEEETSAGRAINAVAQGRAHHRVRVQRFGLAPMTAPRSLHGLRGIVFLP